MGTIAFSRDFGIRLALIATAVLSLSVVAGKSHSMPMLRFTDLVVTFAPGEISKPPQIANGSLKISTEQKSAAIAELAIAVECVHECRDRLSPSYSIAGPWRVTLLTDLDPESIVVSLRSNPLVESADFATAEPAGELPEVWFPGAERDLFCPSQAQLHRPVDGVPGSSLDPCGAFESASDFDMDLPQAWEITQGDSSVVVAIIDTGFDLFHPNLGGQGPTTSVSDSLLYYNQGIWFRNWREVPGDLYADGMPGEAGVNDDPEWDDYTDEDCWGNLPGDLPESGVSVGIWTTLGPYTISDITKNWVPGSLVGQKVTLVRAPTYATTTVYETIVANDATTITTSGTNLIDLLISWGRPGWATYQDADYYPQFVGYKIGNGLDDDGDGKFDDIGYVGCPNDDDENGMEDDYRGWDFYDAPRHLVAGVQMGCDKEDYTDQDNDPRSFYDHGTMVASQVASALDSGRMMGVAPKVKVLPLRNGAQYNCGTENHATAGIPMHAVDYAVQMGADVISLSFGPTGGIPWTAIGRAIDAGVVVVISAGNEVASPWGTVTPSNPVIFVAGLDSEDRRWNQTTPEHANESNYGAWVDVAARAQDVTCSVWGVMPHVPDGGGDPVPWLPPARWHGYVADGGLSGTSLAAPIVAGIVALVKSAYPEMSSNEVVRKIVGSTDDIYADHRNDGLEGLLGSGRVNAYKALTYYGSVAASTDTTWAHNIWTGGDIHVPEGRTLTIAAGDTVRVAIDDLLSAGNPNEIEFVIDGTLQINGTTSAPVVFESFGGSHLRWTYNHSITISGETFTCGGLGCAAIASSASYQLMPDVSTTSQVFAVRLTPAAPLSGVTVDLGGLGLTGTILSLLDNGTGEDLVSGDGIYTSSTFSALLAPGTYSVRVSANAASGGYTRRNVSVDVPELVAKFTNVSSEVGLNYTGKPYSATNGKFVSTGQSGLAVTTMDSDSPVYQIAEVLPSGAPRFTSVGVLLSQNGARGLAAADFDNDGDEDIFVASAQAPKLWRNDAGTYVDVTSAMGLATLALNSASACWGDYDNDGWLDLFVTRCTAPGAEPPGRANILFEQHRLLRNLCGSSCGFQDVTSSAGLDGPYAPVGMTAAWGDVEGDGDLDLIVPDISDLGYGNTALFVNYGNGTFANERSGRFTTPGQYWGYDVDWGSGAVWADMDNDQDLDIVVSCAGPGSRILMNNGQGEFPAAMIRNLATSQDKYSGVQVLDHNLDGWLDVLLLSGEAGHASRLFLGKPSVDGVQFVESTHNAGLAHTSNGMGILAADFTSDGDADVFIGRRTMDGQFFYKTDSQAGSNSLGRRYVKVRLESPTANGVNRQGIGAVVSVAAGGLVQTQVVDGGSGRGGQSDRTLTFGLGDYVGQVTATVRWPGGVVQSDVELVVSGAGAGETVNLISDAAPVVSNVNVATYIVPGISFYDWEFSWDTDVATKAADDVVTIIQDGIENPCWPGWTTISSASYGVIYTYAGRAGGGYTHKLRIDHEACNLGCSFYYAATSGTGLHSVTSTPPKFKKIKLCPAEY